MEEIKNCKRCGRQLKTSRSIDREYGPVCYKKHLKEQADAEFERKQMKIEQLGV